MLRQIQLKKNLPRALALGLSALAIASAIAADPLGHIRGTIVSATPDKLTVKTSSGDVSVAVDTTTRIAGVIPSNLDQIKSGTFVGIANVPGPKTSKALEVVVFPDSMKGSGLGDYPWDLDPVKGDAAKTSAMTNGTVKAAAAGGAKTSAMTNGTVKSESTGKSLTLTVDYGKGEKKIVVPAGVPVVGLIPGDASKLVAGAHVFVATKKDAPASAGFIAVGIDGAVPPM